MSTEPHIPNSWTEAECWAWSQIQSGKIADFNQRYNKELRPENPEGWPENNQDRRLSQGFLETVLSDNRFEDQMTHKGAQIVGAWIEDLINLQHVQLSRQLWLEYCRIEHSLNLMNLCVDGWLSLEGSWVGGDIDLNGAKLSSHVSMKEVIINGDVDFTGAKIGGQIDMGGSQFRGELSMNGILVDQDLLMGEKATFFKINLTGATVGAQVNLTGSRCEELLILNSCEIGQHLLMGQQSVFKNVNLVSARIRGLVDLSNATITELLIMNGAEVSQDFLMAQNAAVQEANMRGAHIHGYLDMSGITFNGNLSMSAVSIGQNLYMRDGAQFGSVDLTNARIKGQIDLIGSDVHGEFVLSGAEIGRHLFMRDGATFTEVNMTNIHVGGQLDLSGSVVSENLNMNAVKVGQSVFMRNHSTLKNVDLNSADIGGQLTMSDSTFEGYLSMDGVQVKQGIFARYTKFYTTEPEVILYYSHIGSDLDISGAELGTINLTGTVIKGELRLGSASGHAPTVWMDNSTLILRNTMVEAIQDTEGSWPDFLELEGFTYRHLGGLGAEGIADIQKRKREWFIKWLQRDKTFSPQPYEYLANLLRTSGYPSKANAILYASRKQARQEAWVGYQQGENSWMRWVGMLLLETTIGYGLGSRYFRVLWWFAAFTLLGFLILLGSTDQSQWDIFHMAWASFDQVLPLVKLNPIHESTILGNYSMGVIAYFYFHKLVGYVLGGFLAAGLAGLTQRS